MGAAVAEGESRVARCRRVRAWKQGKLPDSGVVRGGRINHPQPTPGGLDSALTDQEGSPKARSP